MKELFDSIIDVTVTVVITFLIGYALLCGFAYSITAAPEIQRTPYGLILDSNGEPKALTHEMKVVALTILGEARGENATGMYAVACVIQNRADKKKKTLTEICLAPKQFSVWNGGKTVKDLKHLWQSDSAAYAITLAHAMCKGYKLVQTFTGNADHYYSKKIMRNPPSWAYKINKKTGKFLRDKKGNKIPLKPTRVIKNHVFYKLS